MSAFATAIALPFAFSVPPPIVRGPDETKLEPVPSINVPEPTLVSEPFVRIAVVVPPPTFMVAKLQESSELALVQ